MVSNPKAELYQMFPIPLYVRRYEGDTTEIVKYLHSIELHEHNPGYGMI